VVALFTRTHNTAFLVGGMLYPVKLFRGSAITLLVAYFLWPLVNWMRYSPGRIDADLQSRIRPGMQAAEIVSTLRTPGVLVLPPRAYCAPASPVTVKRISLYTPGAVWLVFLSITTTTTFCYDQNDNLLAFKTARWIDGL
jgi:hypothetical protein